ncbi:hypothetical protein HN865_00385 [Candidatus Woesearchaeota archaeon]|jgi:hypothetical protein|nr:hypothetical protein [Candidatus Woesearchaeota archaeon]MBT7237298.1 hypothetical protein [Candidatus Woesearchaeota archaeon]
MLNELEQMVGEPIIVDRGECPSYFGPSVTLDTMYTWGSSIPCDKIVPINIGGRTTLKIGINIDTDKSTYQDLPEDGGVVIIKEGIGPIKNTYIHHDNGWGRETSVIKQDLPFDQDVVEKQIKNTIKNFSEYEIDLGIVKKW